MNLCKLVQLGEELRNSMIELNVWHTAMSSTIDNNDKN